MLDWDSSWPTASTTGPFKLRKSLLFDMVDNPEVFSKKQEQKKAELALLRHAMESIPLSLDMPETF